MKYRYRICETINGFYIEVEKEIKTGIWPFKKNTTTFVMADIMGRPAELGRFRFNFPLCPNFKSLHDAKEKIEYWIKLREEPKYHYL